MITVSSNQCGGNWSVPGPGWHTFEIDNQSTGGGEIDLIDPANGAIYAEVENTGPGTVTPMRLNLGSGTYAFMCNFNDFNPQVGAKVTVGGHAKGTPAILPVSYNETIPYAKKYQAYAEAGLKVLAGQTATLAADVRRGRPGGGEAGLAHRPPAVPDARRGVRDVRRLRRRDRRRTRTPPGCAARSGPGSTAWSTGCGTGSPAHELTPVAARSSKDVNALLAWWPTQQIPLSDVGLRTHEILENALQFQLTGHDDYGSGTTLATTLANIAGHPRAARPCCTRCSRPRYPGLPAVYSGLDRLQSLLEKEHRPNGTWVPVAALPTSARQAIDAACGAVLQSLAPIASITEPRNTAQ